MHGDCLGIMMLGMEELRTGAFRELPNAMFSNAILMVRIDSTERDHLLGVMDFVHKRFGSKNTVVTMVVLDGYAVKVSISLESALCLNGFLSIGSMLNMDIGQAGGMVDENRSNMIAASCQFAGVLGYESG